MPLTWAAVLDELRRADLLVAAPADRGPDPSGIGVDSRTAVPGMLYLAVRGSQADGHRFVRPMRFAAGPRPSCWRRRSSLASLRSWCETVNGPRWFWAVHGTGIRLGPSR